MATNIVSSEHDVERTISVFIGSSKDEELFAWAKHKRISYRRKEDQPLVVLLLSSEEQEDMHIPVIILSDEVTVLNLNGYLDPRMLFEVCIAHNKGKSITWLENPQMYCPRCRCVGPLSEHFFHQAATLHEFNLMYENLTEEQIQYLPGNLVDWYGQIAPLVLLKNNLPALKVDLGCIRCLEHHTFFALPGEYGAFSTLVNSSGMLVTDLCSENDADRLLLCENCRKEINQEEGTEIWISEISGL